MAISIHQIFAKLHSVCNRTIIVGVLVLCGLIVFLVMNHETPPLEKSHSFVVLKEDFLRAVRAYDIKSAKRLYGYLKEKNPYSPFVEEAAPAYLADIYLYYANKMAFNPEAAGVFLAEARRLAPDHPLLSPCPNCESPAFVEKAQALSTQITETEKIAAQETDAYIAALTVLEQAIDAIEAARVREEAARLHAMIAEVESLSLPEPDVMPVSLQALIEPPAPGVKALLPQTEIDETPNIDLPNIALLEPPVALAASTDDACLLSYYTRNAPVSTCMDVVSENQYGPALFVVGEEGVSPLAFTQQPITRDAFQALCSETHACAPDATVKKSTVAGVALDLSDVENTVQHYNAFCQMSQSCSGLVSGAASVLLEKEKLPEYAAVLSKHTGYTYRVMTESDVNVITDYFKTCVANGQCEEALGTDLAKFLETSQDELLVRVM